MADEPVSAYREPLAARARRWARRHRTAVASAAVAAGLTLADLAAVALVQSRANALLVAERSRVQQRYTLAADAIRLFHGEVSEDLLLKEAKFGGLRSKLLRARPTSTDGSRACSAIRPTATRGPRSAGSTTSWAS